jgi:hypothetical protein
MAKKTTVKHTAKKSEGIIETMNEWFDKAPSLPKSWKSGLVTITPWIAIIFGILGIVSGGSGLLTLTAASPFAAMAGASMMNELGGGVVASVILLISSVLLLAAFPGTKARKMGGWNLLFWSEVVSLVGSLIGFSFVSGIIGALIGFYLLFQIRPFYK